MHFWFALLISSFSFSQNENNKWYFGSAAGLDFVTNPPTPISTSAMLLTNGVKEGTSSISDAFGKLVFYTDGTTIWNKVDQVMANGSGLIGQLPRTQAALIVKQPGNSNIYFVFTLGTLGLCYTTVDMNLAAGNGSVTAKNTPLGGPTTEKLAGTKHCNGIDTWVLTHDYGTDAFRCHLVTSAGVSATPTLSSAGKFLITPNQTYGYAKFSQNGKKLGCGFYHNTINFANFELYDFDNSTGVVSNSLSLSIPLNVPAYPPSTNPSPPPSRIPKPAVLYPYGCEFSPDGTKFYGSAAGDTVMFQWDLCAGTANDIVNSRYKIKSFTSAAMQLGKDGKIYVARVNKQALGVINDPNLAGAACNYVAQGLSIAPSVCSYGMTNFVSEPPRVPFTYVINGSVSCNTATFVSPPMPTSTLTTCGITGYNATSHVWYFGDPASGAANTSTLTNPVHIYPGQGTYTAALVYTYNNSCGGVNTDTLKQEVKIGVLPLLSSAGFNLCTGDSLVLSAVGAQTHSWSTGVTSSSIVVSPLTTSAYTVSGTDKDGCPYITTQTVNVYISPTLSVTGPTVICPGYQVKLKGEGANTYSWSSGYMIPMNTVIQWQPSVTYTLWGNSNGCVKTKTVTVLLKKPDVFITGGDATVCAGTPVSYTASGTRDYYWSNGTYENTVTIIPTVTKVYTVQGMDKVGCTNTATVLITIQAQPAIVDFSYKSPVCERTRTIDPVPSGNFNAGGIYSSAELDVDSLTGQLNTFASTSGTYQVNYALAAKGCTAAGKSSATLAIIPLPQLVMPSLTRVDPGGSLPLPVSGAMSYTWEPAEYLSCVNCDSPVSTPYKDIQYCVRAELNSCLTQSCVEIKIVCDTTADYSLPNAFTPNGDGLNDAFCLQGWSSCTENFRMMIFNSWGEKVFESSEPGFCWDGSYQGKLLDAGVFAYVASVRNWSSRTTIKRKGNISLIR